MVFYVVCKNNKYNRLQQLGMLSFVLPTEICTHLNSKDQDSLADHMAKMKREAKKRKIERKVQGFRESLHLAKTNLLHLCDSHGQMPIQYPCPRNTPGIHGTHRKQISFPLAFFKRTIPFFLSFGQYTVDQSFTDGFSRLLCRAFRATGVLTLKLTVSKSSLITLSFTPTCFLCSRLTALATCVRLVSTCYGITQ